MIKPEFSRPIAVEQIGRAARDVTVEADAAECAALARRMGLPAVESLRCAFALRRATDAAGVIAAEGRLMARVVQVCVVTLDEFTADVAETFAIRFVPAGTESAEIDLDGPDEVPYEAGRVDLGEAAAEQLALALDPFPRLPGVAMPEEDDAAAGRPFASLGKLRRH
ncbi:MAG TPA: YceD family protein [Acetobacteraceae bacterium]|nr:YceD family protein [Acetobacteraceae bacterium]